MIRECTTKKCWENVSSTVEMNELAVMNMREYYDMKTRMNISFLERIKKEDLDLIHTLSFSSCFTIYHHEESICTEISQRIKAGEFIPKDVFILWACAQNFLKSAKFISTYYIDSHCVDFEGPGMQKYKEATMRSLKGHAIADGSRSRKYIANMPRMVNQLGLNFFNPLHFRQSLLTAYFKAVMSAAEGMNFLKESSTDDRMKAFYAQTGERYKAAAIEAYREHVYKGEYASNPQRESAYILAQVRDRIGDAHPLIDFYVTLHQERQRQKQEKRERNTREKQLKIEVIQAGQEERRVREIRELEEVNQRQKEAETSSKIIKAGATRPTSEPLFEVFAMENRGGREKKEPVVISKNEQRRLDREGKGKEKFVEEDNQSFEEEEPNEIVLDSPTYETFQCLTGQSVDRNVTLSDVVKLLTELRCIIKPGGNHIKAKAPNGGAWTLPPEWDGPIPAPYRAELNEFLQGTMDIDPQFVVLKNKK
jgi:hypothetical protein